MNRRAATGFTLVETLVALFIFGLLASAGAYTLGVSVENAQAVEAVADELQDLQRTRAILRSDLGQMADRPTRDSAGEPRGVLTGGEGADILLGFARYGPDNSGAARPSLQYVEYSMTEAGLERRAAVQLDGSAMSPAALMLPQASAAEVDFHYDGAWSDTVQPRPAPLPDAVRLVITHPRFGRVEQLFLVGAA